MITQTCAAQSVTGVVKAPPFRVFCKSGPQALVPFQDLQDEWRWVRENLRETARRWKLLDRHQLEALCLLLCHYRNRATGWAGVTQVQPSVFLRRPIHALVALLASFSFYVAFMIYWWTTPDDAKRRW